MIVNGLEHIYHSDIAKAAAPAVLSGLRHAVDGAGIVVAVGAVATAAIIAYSLARDKEGIVVAFGAVVGTVYAIPAGAAVGFAYGVGKSILMGNS